MIFLSQSKKTRDKDNTKFRVKSYKSWTRDPVPSHRSQTRSLAFFFSYKSCIPNQPLIRKINLLKGSVTPRGIFCGRSGRWKKKKEERDGMVFSRITGFRVLFSPRTCIARFNKVSTKFPRFGCTVCVFRNVCVFQIPGPSRGLPGERDLPLDVQLVEKSNQ